MTNKQKCTKCAEDSIQGLGLCHYHWAVRGWGVALIASYRRAEEAFNKAEKALETYFLPRIKDALNKNNMPEAYTIMHAIPDSVTRVFAQDMIRQKETKGAE